MPDNIFTGNNIVKAKTTIGVDAIFTPDDTLIVRGLSNGNYISYQPGRGVNSLDIIESGKGYLVTSKTNRDLTTIFGDPEGNAGIVTLI